MSAPSAKQPVVEAAKATAVAPKQMPGYGWKHMPMASAISYSAISIAITLINKVVLSTYCEQPRPGARSQCLAPPTHAPSPRMLPPHCTTPPPHACLQPSRAP
jgi:hypothetical protein